MFQERAFDRSHLKTLAISALSHSSRGDSVGTGDSGSAWGLVLMGGVCHPDSHGITCDSWGKSLGLGLAYT